MHWFINKSPPCRPDLLISSVVYLFICKNVSRVKLKKKGKINTWTSVIMSKSCSNKTAPPACVCIEGGAMTLLSPDSWSNCWAGRVSGQQRALTRTPHADLGSDNNRLIKSEATAHQWDQTISSWGWASSYICWKSVVLVLSYLILS